MTDFILRSLSGIVSNILTLVDKFSSSTLSGILSNTSNYKYYIDASGNKSQNTLYQDTDKVIRNAITSCTHSTQSWPRDNNNSKNISVVIFSNGQCATVWLQLDSYSFRIFPPATGPMCYSLFLKRLTSTVYTKTHRGALSEKAV